MKMVSRSKTANFKDKLCTSINIHLLTGCPLVVLFLQNISYQYFNVYIHIYTYI